MYTLLEKYFFAIFAFEFVKNKNCKIMPEIHTCSGQNTFIYCSSITVVLVHVNILFKIHLVCHNIANGIEPGSD